MVVDYDKSGMIDIISGVVKKAIGEEPADVFFDPDRKSRKIEAVFKIRGEGHLISFEIDRKGNPAAVVIDGKSYAV